MRQSHISAGRNHGTNNLWMFKKCRLVDLSNIRDKSEHWYITLYNRRFLVALIAFYILQDRMSWQFELRLQLVEHVMDIFPSQRPRCSLCMIIWIGSNFLRPVTYRECIHISTSSIMIAKKHWSSTRIHLLVNQTEILGYFLDNEWERIHYCMFRYVQMTDLDQILHLPSTKWWSRMRKLGFVWKT